MIFTGQDFKFFFDGEIKTREEIEKLVDYNTTVSITGLDVHYLSPIKERMEIAEKFKLEALRKMGITSIGCKKQSSQGTYSNLEDSPISAKKADKAQMIIDLANESKNSFVECNSEKYLRKKYGEEVTIFRNIRGLYQINFPPKKDKIQELLEEVNKHQEQNGGRVGGVEFPFDEDSELLNWIDFINSTKEEREQKVIEDWNRKIQESSSVEKNNFVPGFGFIPKRGKNIYCDNQKIGEKANKKEAKKETEGKLFYELDFEFIKQMAERMQSNKDNSKYEMWNWQKPMTPKGIENLKQAMWRHIIAVMQGEFEDDGREFGHLEAISNNAMMINYQLKNNLK